MNQSLRSVAYNSIKKNSLILYEIQTSIDMPNASVKIIDFPIHYCHLNVIKAYFDREMRNQKY